MCGIVGFLSGGSPRADSAEILCGMVERLSHRGPNAGGTWHSPDGAVALGHRRLSILDLSPSGGQPMVSKDERFAISYNGEIYNFKDLRLALERLGATFRGTSDTEVLLEAIRTWGVEGVLPRLNGMFAFAVWDCVERKLHLARDRFGEKPLYYGLHQGVLLFASELKAFASHPAFQRELDDESISLFFRYNYIPAPHTIFKNTWKVVPGHCVTIGGNGKLLKNMAYWDFRRSVCGRSLVDLAATDPEVTNMVESSLLRAVSQRMVADVPLGAFLSGGIDSSLIVALMQAQSTRPIKTFTIGFWEAAYNEAKEAASVARHLGTEHHEFYLSSRECLEVIPGLSDIYDEPFADSSQIPTSLVSKLTSKHVSVVLSGDGGDELWGGYNRYYWSMRLWPKIQRIPAFARQPFADVLRMAGPATWDRIFGILDPIVPKRLKVRGGGEKIHKVAEALVGLSIDDLYGSFVSQSQHPEELLLQSARSPFLADHRRQVPDNLNFIERMMYLDMVTYLPDDVLCKVDRATMSAGLESRVPFLDNEHVALAWSVPITTKIYGGVGKWPLRQVLKRYVPEALFDRPKVGFGIPIGEWLRGPLRSWADDMLHGQNLEAGGVLRSEAVRALWNEHVSGQANRQHSLWGILMFQQWLQRKWD